MRVRCVPRYRKRPSRKVEVILSKRECPDRKVVRMSVRPVRQPVEDDEYLCEDFYPQFPPIEEEIVLTEIIDELPPEPVEEVMEGEELEEEPEPEIEAEVDELMQILLEQPAAQIEEEEYAVYPQEAEERTATIEEINADFAELAQDVDERLSECEPIADEEVRSIPADESDGRMYRHFERDNEGERYETDENAAEGHEVACFSESGKLTRVCGVMRKGGGQRTFEHEQPDAVGEFYERAADAMFGDTGDTQE